MRRRDGEGRSLGLGSRRFWIRIEFRRVGSGGGSLGLGFQDFGLGLEELDLKVVKKK